MNAILENLLDIEIREAVAKYHLPFSEALAAELKARIQISWLRDTPVMSVRDESGLTLTVDACVAAIKTDPEYAKQFLQNNSEGANPTLGPPRISLRDQAGQCDNFAKIAAGTVEIFDDRG
jgi:hypothetical protein